MLRPLKASVSLRLMDEAKGDGGNETGATGEIGDVDGTCKYVLEDVILVRGDGFGFKADDVGPCPFSDSVVEGSCPRLISSLVIIVTIK